LPRGLSALIEIGIMFLPAIPAYIWVWPKVSGMSETIFQTLVYLYVLAGTIIIGRRRWSWSELGINRQGIGLGLGCAVFFIIARFLIIKGFDWKVAPPTISMGSLIWSIFFYIALVGLVEELLFRGLVYRALEDWRGIAPTRRAARWAIWGSSFGFLLWHIFGQGVFVGISSLAIGLVFALIRWRAGGIVGLIFLHGLWDLESTLMVAPDNASIFGQGMPVMISPALILAGTVLLVMVPLYVWFLHPWFAAKLHGLHF
jgi:membrane protease YdiL (CAAX protease family)